MVAKGTDVTAKDEGKTVWMWKEESSTPSSVAASADSDMALDTVKSSSARKAVHKVHSSPLKVTRFAKISIDLITLDNLLIFQCFLCTI